MEESVWETLDTSDIVDTILTPMTTPSPPPPSPPSPPSHQLKIPQIHCTIEKHKLNPFITSDYIQLLESVMTKNFKPSQSSNRINFHSWLADTIDTNDPKCTNFLKNSTKQLARVKNKRQLILFLKRNFNKQSKKQPPTHSPYRLLIFFNLLAYTTLILVLLTTLFSFLLLNTNYIETVFSNSKYLPAMKALKAVIVALWH